MFDNMITRLKNLKILDKWLKDLIFKVSIIFSWVVYCWKGCYGVFYGVEIGVFLKLGLSK